MRSELAAQSGVPRAEEGGGGGSRMRAGSSQVSQLSSCTEAEAAVEAAAEASVDVAEEAAVKASMHPG